MWCSKGRMDRKLLREQRQPRKETLGEMKAERRGVGASLQDGPHEPRLLMSMPSRSLSPRLTGLTSVTTEL